ncbi:MAG: hypothetical protein EON58_02815 [Alphaproteobacteria bacterium]|nr:MAG: hypothetical protein EON58_02815 [Alphaproteobacteria bacterium]
MIYSGRRLSNSGWNTWRLTALRQKTIVGSTSLPDYTFTATQSSSGCRVTPLPKRGEKWVIYFDRRAPSRVVEAFPLPLAREHDPRLTDVL